MESAYRIAVLMLLAAIVGAVVYEGEKITANQYHFSGMDIQQVQIVNARRDPIPIEAVAPVTVAGEVAVNGGTIQGQLLPEPVAVRVTRY